MSGGMTMRKFGALLASSAIAVVALSAAAHAGGFQRGTADTDILYEKGTFSSRFGFTYVDPNRGFSSINGVEADYDDYTGTYKIPSGAIAFGNETVSCAGTMTESFAAEADYEGGLPRQVSASVNPAFNGISNVDRLNFSTATASSSTIGTEFDSSEFGATCRVSYTNDMGRFSLLGGIFTEDFDFNGQSAGERYFNNPASGLNGFAGTPLAAAGGLLNVSGAQLVLPSFVDVDTSGGFQTGYRIGAAYERPDIALRFQVMYRSEVEHDDIRGDGSVTISDTAFVRLANGQSVSVPTFFANPAFGLSAAQRAGITGGIAGSLPANGTVIPVSSTLSDSISPQSLTINAQTGIAAGTLLLASFRWTDWSTNNAVVSTISSAQTGTSSSYAPYNWDDGYTASIGIGKAFNEQISGAISLGYDSGVSSGADTTYTDLYTVSGGVSFKPDSWGEIRVGGLVGYWTDGEQRIEDGAYFNADVDDTIVLAGNVSLKLTF